LIKKEILRYFSDPAIAKGCKEAIAKEKERLSWNKFCTSLTDFANELK